MPNPYSITFALGAMAGLLWLGLVNPTIKRAQSSFPSTLRIDAGIIALLAGLAGARLGFIIAHWGYFSSQTNKIVRFWDGGLNWVGGAIGVLIGLALFAFFSRLSYWRLLDLLALPAAFMAFAAWLGCLLEGCAYGRPASLGGLSPLSVDIFGTQAERWPVQGMGAILSIVTIILLFILRGQQARDGIMATTSLALISFTSLALAFTRGDPVRLFQDIRLDALSSALLLAIALLGLAFKIWKG
ncbi:MAG: hypothetical protein GTO18_05845 [Anaerolineales bacterium]|nr:hypothetical protein [Anaerolineales bacterium]